MFFFFFFAFVSIHVNLSQYEIRLGVTKPRHQPFWGINGLTPQPMRRPMPFPKCSEKSHLRSTTISSTFPRFLAFTPNITTRGVWTCATASTSMMACCISCSLNVFHGFIIVSIILIIPNFSHCSSDVDFSALKQIIHYLTNPQISGAKPARVAISGLGFRLQPEKVPLRA
jgi:hypothetical protein